MKNRNKYILTISLIFYLFQVKSQSTNNKKQVEYFTANVFNITEVMLHDVVNPPAAARFYAYSSLTAYLIYKDLAAENKSVKKIFKGVLSYPVQSTSAQVDPYFAATYGLLETARLIIPSGVTLDEKQKLLYQNYLKLGVKKQVLDSSAGYARKVANAVAKYAKTDGYLSLSVLQRYEPKENPGTWKPTPPEYMAAVEPHWRTVKTFFIDSATQFKPLPPVAFDSAQSSSFLKLTLEVYEVNRKLTADQLLIARYWDCNPFAFFYSGHVNLGIKKISPGGHWMSITGIACRKANLSFEKTTLVHAVVAMGLHDAFVSCWDEKYRSDRLRPKTAINQYVDKTWNPILETPPFPEYTSGHSVISSTSAALLTYFLGENFEFIDNTEVFFGMPERRFKSFHQAAQEAALSRLYGGIHFRDAIEEGEKQGVAISGFIIHELKKMN